MSPRVLMIVAATALPLCTTACGVKGPLVPAPKAESDAVTPSSTTAPPTAPPLIKDPAQPERRP
ncbi:MAG TPA: hypothetical protein VGL25_10595 [Casimicrobiaceae bacterium]